MMIKYFALSVSILLMVSPKGFSQTSNDQSNKLRLYGSLGFRPVVMGQTDIYFRYVDESPSRDNIRTTFTVDQKKVAPSLRFGAEYNFTKDYFGSAGMEFAVDNSRTWALQCGIGRFLPQKHFTLRPEIALEYGAGGIYLGEIKNNDVYIQVNDQQFYSNTVSVSLMKSFFAIRPMIGLSKPLAFGDGLFTLTAQLGYNLAVASGSMDLNFSGQDKEDKSAAATESIYANNVYLGLNSGSVNPGFIKHSGLFFNVGLMFTLN